MSTRKKWILYILAVIVGCIAVAIVTVIQRPELVLNQKMSKPVIYLYPQEKTDYNIKLDYEGEFTFTYPVYDDGWNITAEPTGILTDVKTNKELNYLFWEGMSKTKFSIEKGFVVEKSEVISFLEEKLEILGLNSREAEDFITFWGPRMIENDYNLVRFLSEDEINQFAKLTVSPEVDTEIRVFMIYKNLHEPIDIDKQILLKPKRSGDVLIEWGGAEYE